MIRAMLICLLLGGCASHVRVGAPTTEFWEAPQQCGPHVANPNQAACEAFKK